MVSDSHLFAAPLFIHFYKVNIDFLIISFLLLHFIKHTFFTSPVYEKEQYFVCIITKNQRPTKTKITSFTQNGRLNCYEEWVVASWYSICSWIVGSIPHGGPIELFLIPASASRLDYQRLWYVLSCLWGGTYKRFLAANWRVACVVVAAGFLPI